MTKPAKLLDRFTKCDSGEWLNPFLHVFMALTFVFSFSFVFFGNTKSLQASVLYINTANQGQHFVNIWGLVGLSVVVLNTLAFLIRGRAGLVMMTLCIFGGIYLWTWAAFVYLLNGAYFQVAVACGPNLFFWYWYATQWSRRRRGERVAFV